MKPDNLSYFNYLVSCRGSGPVNFYLKKKIGAFLKLLPTWSGVIQNVKLIPKCGVMIVYRKIRQLANFTLPPQFRIGLSRTSSACYSQSFCPLSTACTTQYSFLYLWFSESPPQHSFRVDGEIFFWYTKITSFCHTNVRGSSLIYVKLLKVET